MVIAKVFIQGLYFIHKLQQLGYENQKFIKWLEGNQYRPLLIWNIFELLIPLFLMLLLFFNYHIIDLKLYKYIISIIMLSVFSWKLIHPFLAGWVGPRAKVKKPLVYTARVKRLLATLLLLISLFLFFVFLFTVTPFDRFTLSTRAFFKYNAFILLFSVITPITVLAANMANTPLEKFIHLLYFNRARKKLAQSDIKNIGITGSFGKTSTKFFTHQILSEHHATLTTPSSYNTPMGISRVINDEELSNYKIFVAEMGADRFGDINTLCRLVKPDYGILTAIGIQHLKTFETEDNIIKTKFSLLENVKPDGFGIYNYDNEIIKKNMHRFDIKARLYSYSIDKENAAKVDIYAENIRHTREGLSFKAIFKDGRELEINTELLGRHNAQNLLASILTADLLGLSEEEIKRGVRKIKPVEHRLQKIDPGTGVLILDDAFNSNISGATEALNVLREIEGNKKILITPGLVELGEEEQKANRNFGNHIAGKADITILIGKERTKDIYEGIMEKRGSEDNLYVVNSLNEAQEILKTVVAPGDVVLFENDLPDTYSEE